MNNEIEIPVMLTAPSGAHQLHLVLAPRPMISSLMSTVIARLARQGAVQVLDGGNSFDAYRIARLIRQPAAAGDPSGAAFVTLDRIRVARAFTCYQVEAMLAKPQCGASRNVAIIVLDLLDTFYDENTPASERLRLLNRCLLQLQRACQSTTVVVSARFLSDRFLSDRLRQSPPQVQRPGQPDEFLKRLEESAQQVWRFEEPPARPAQVRLF
jgi:hypothetical protein